MKRILTGFCALSLMFMTACNSWIDSDLNTDPTSPSDASYNVVMPTVQAGLAYAYGGDLGRYTNLFTQHITGVDRQHLGIFNYKLTESDIDNAWQFNLYAGPMKDLAIMMDKARADGSAHYLGVSQVLMAHALGTVTDMWGDVPFSDAFKGSAGLQPKYDTQQSIYTAIQAMLDSAIVNLGAATSTLSPGADDRMYDGDLTLWTKAAYSLKVRNTMHLLKRDAGAAATALALLPNAFTSNADDMQFVFGTAETEGNPWYQFIIQRDGDITAGPKIMELMDAANDPRRTLYFEADDSGRVSVASRLGPFYASINSPVPFVTFVEIKFIESEARFLGGDMAGAHTAYTEAVRAGLERTGIAASEVTAYLAQAAVDPGSANLTLELILNQKYIAMFTQPEAFTDLRRTGFPLLTPTTSTEIPRRFPYPQSERLTNGANVPAGLTIFDRVWWDVP